MITIMSGVPGAGKSTWLELNRPNAYVVSADDFFRTGGSYRYNGAQLNDAHAACMRAFIEALQADEDSIAVDNTNVTVAEINPYYLVGRAYDREIELVTVRCSPEVAHARCIHNVPLEHIVRKTSTLERRHLPQIMGDLRILDVNT